MRIAYVSRAYPGVAAEFYAAHPGLERESSEAQRTAFETNAFGWAGGWGPALAPHGHELSEFWLDLEPQHRAWARERGLPEAGSGAEDLVVARLREFDPEILWLDHPDEVLLGRASEACPGLRVTLGWVGSALPDRPIWRKFDCVLSCDAESVATLERGGARASLLHHAFQERVLKRLVERAPSLDAVFVGQFDPGAPSHAAREQVVDALLENHRVAVFSPPSRRSGGFETAARGAVWSVAAGLRRAGVPETALRRVPGLGRAAAWPGAPRGAPSARLAAAIQPARYGLAMYQTFRDARVTLNVQGFGPVHVSSNMRLFEATGVGSCLLTDATGGTAEFFVPGREAVTFESSAECVEKMTWLLEHEAERAVIAQAGQTRCLAEHTFAHRAPRLAEILREMTK
ncbi:MAG: glycosyltransferase [Candidatus Eisenbacteria bacterium]